MTLPPSVSSAGADESFAALEAVAREFIGGYNDRDLNRILAVCDPEIEYHPSRIHGSGVYHGHDGMRAWWRESAERAMFFEVRADSFRQVELRYTERRVDSSGAITDRARLSGHSVTEHPRRRDRRTGGSSIAILGELCSDGHSLGPWAAVYGIRGGLIVDCRGYLTPGSMLAELGIVDAPESSKR